MGDGKPVEVAVPGELDGAPLEAAVKRLFDMTWGQARERIRRGKIELDGVPALDPKRPVKAGGRVAFRPAAPRLGGRGALPEAALRHVDAQVVVVDKPPGVSTVPFEEGERGTLDERVRELLGRRARAAGGGKGPPAALGVVHRLDKETSGLLVFTRTWQAKAALAAQFRAHTVQRRYLALAHGAVDSTTIRSRLTADRGDGRRGSIGHWPGTRRLDPERDGQLAVTHVEVLERLAGATLVACRLETGRQHQIRIHLAEARHPLLGERVYVRGYLGEWLPAPRVMLHAAELGFVHPATGRPVHWELPPPADMVEVLERLRRGPSPRPRLTPPRRSG